MYRNPYIDAESAKSKSLLKSLHKARIEVALMSPFMKNLKNLCDSDSDSASDEKEVRIIRKKLDFLDTSDKENLSDLKHRIKKNQSKGKIKSDKSVKEDFSDVDEDDLETRIKKKLDKKTGPSVKSSSKIRDLNTDDKSGRKHPKKSHKETSTSSSTSDDNEQWWKPSRKSELKLYKETKTVKVFSFLASLSSIFFLIQFLCS